MVNESKKELVQELVRDILQYPIIGLVDLHNLPAKQYQTMRSLLNKRNVKIRMARKRLLERALIESKRGNIDQLTAKLRGMPALIFTQDNPFALYNTIQKNKSPAAAKPGQTVNNEIMVKAGPTSFAPGPIISELAAVGIKTKVEGGKLTIMQDTMVAKEGDIVSQKLAETLKRLDIKPMEIGLNLVAVWENGVVFNAKQLHIDEAQYSSNFTSAAQWAINLAVEIAYPTADTTDLLLQRAYRDAKGLAIEQNIITAETLPDILAKADREAASVKKSAGVE